MLVKARVTLYVQVLFILCCLTAEAIKYLPRRRADFIDKVDPITGEINAPELRANDDGTNVDFDGVSVTEGSCHSEDSMSTSGEEILCQVPVEPCLRFKYMQAITQTVPTLKPISSKDLLCWAWQGSRDMRYLGVRKVVHGDLAARNILLADNNVIQICDFGLAKALYNDDYYNQEGGDPLPIKWMAIEAIKDLRFSIESDVWSFGIVLWEFFTLAEKSSAIITRSEIFLQYYLDLSNQYSTYMKSEKKDYLTINLLQNEAGLLSVEQKQVELTMSNILPDESDLKPSSLDTNETMN